jgi:hypothetical protein
MLTATKADQSNKLLALLPNTKKARFVVMARRATILSVEQMGCFSQIADTVIGPHAVDVVNLSVRPLAVVKQPSHSMRQVVNPSELERPISSVFFDVSGDSSGLPPPNVNLPMDFASVLVVAQSLPQVIFKHCSTP